MNKILLLILLTVCLAGCSGVKHSVEDYADEPEKILRDPHFGSYKEQLDAIEHSYLKKEITYAEYLEKKKEIDAKYDKEVEQRTEKILAPAY